MSQFLIRLFVRNYKDTESPVVRERYGTFAGIVGIICNLLLCSAKILIGTLTASISIVADGLNNLADMGSSIISMVGFKLAGKPADSDHPFGHGRMEYMSAFIVAVLIIIVGFELFSDSVSALVAGDAAPIYGKWSVIILAASILVKLWMFIFNRLCGKMIKSDVLFATAQDSINDVITTAVILLSVVISMLVTVPFNLDAAMGTAVGVFIIYSGIKTAKSTLDEILGQPISDELMHSLEQTIMSFDGFIGIHDLMVHNYGPGRQFASVHIEVPSDSDIVRCHEQVDLCEKVVQKKLGISLVIHMDPIDVNDEYVMGTRAAVAEKVREIDGNLSIHDFRMTPKGENRTNLIFDVVVPSSVKISQNDIKSKIEAVAKNIDKTFCCVITFDSDFTGK